MAAVQPIRTFQDLQAHAITAWVQPITICLPAAQGVQGNSLKVTLRETDSEHPIPMPLFEYELEMIFKEGTAAGGRKWWFRARDEPKGTIKQAKFDCSLLFVCPHYRVSYKKQETFGERESRHLACVQYHAQCRLKGSVVTSDPSVALVITGTLKQSVRDIVQMLLLKHGKAEILKLGLKYQVAFVFLNDCTASDAEVDIDQKSIERSQLKQHLKRNENLQVRRQVRHSWHVYTLRNEHTGHVQPMLPCKKCFTSSAQLARFQAAQQSAASAQQTRTFRAAGTSAPRNNSKQQWKTTRNLTLHLIMKSHLSDHTPVLSEDTNTERWYHSAQGGSPNERSPAVEPRPSATAAAIVGDSRFYTKQYQNPVDILLGISS
jgi:hypothetical protein